MKPENCLKKKDGNLTKELNFLDKFPINFIFLVHHFLNGVPESVPINPPHKAIFKGFY
jgi:hypothetical protein